ncbi:MAG: hypothetical protein IJC13_00335 [Clostridia bacterium]|nr:hypothetical protein [Clostridia bacterium]
MADCPKVRFEDHTFWNDCKYICTVTGKKMSVDDPKVKHMCKCEYGEEYRDCPIYKDC